MGEPSAAALAAGLLGHGGADAAVRAEQQELRSAKFGRIPTHARVEAQAEQIAGRAVEEHLRGERKAAGRAGRLGTDLVDAGVAAIGDGLEWNCFHDGERDWPSV